MQPRHACPQWGGSAPAYCGFTGARGFSGTCSACALTTPAARPVSVACAPALLGAQSMQSSLPLVSKAAPDTRGRELPRWLGPLSISVSTKTTSDKVMPVHFLFQETHLLCSCDYLLQDWYPLRGVGSLHPGQVPSLGTKEEAWCASKYNEGAK